MLKTHKSQMPRWRMYVCMCVCMYVCMYVCKKCFILRRCYLTDLLPLYVRLMIVASKIPELTLLTASKVSYSCLIVFLECWKLFVAPLAPSTRLEASNKNAFKSFFSRRKKKTFFCRKQSDVRIVGFPHFEGSDFETGLPDFSRYNLPKRGKIYPLAVK
jgi:hypothetical protein